MTHVPVYSAFKLFTFWPGPAVEVLPGLECLQQSFKKILPDFMQQCRLENQLTAVFRSAVWQHEYAPLHQGDCSKRWHKTKHAFV